MYTGVAAGHKVLTALGMTGMPIINVEAGCASGGAALALGVESIRSGRYDCVLVFGMEKMPKGIIRSSFFEPWREEAGLAATPAYFALRAQRLMRDSGVTREHLAQVSVKNHRNGVDNPYAMFRKEFTLESVLASPLVCEPLTLYMLCSPNEGAAAVVLRRARAAPGGVTVRCGGAALASAGQRSRRAHAAVRPGRRRRSVAHRAGGAGRLRGGGPRAGGPRRGRAAGHGLGARAALVRGARACARRARPGAFSTRARRRGAARLPVNPSGGLLSKGEPLGASGLGQIIELYWQLRGEAGARQVAGARVALGHTVGRGANASVVLLRR